MKRTSFCFLICALISLSACTSKIASESVSEDETASYDASEAAPANPVLPSIPGTALALPPIESIQIEKNGWKLLGVGRDSRHINCEPFELDEAKIRRFLSEALHVSNEVFKKEVVGSPCYVLAHLKFSDGQRGIVRIEANYPSGSLMLEDFESRKLYCEQCTWAPFDLFSE